MRRAGPSVLVLLVAVATAGAGSAAIAAGIPWFDPTPLPAPLRADLLHRRALACGPVGSAGLPMPDDVRLVFVSCLGGPYCPAEDRGLGEHEGQLSCPPEPGARQIATMHLVSTLSPARLAAFYRQALGTDYVELAADDGEQATFIEPAAAGTARPWSPRRLHLALSATRGPFADAGYASQIRVTLSVFPPSEPRPVVRCRRFDLLAPHDGPLARWESRYCWW